MVGDAALQLVSAFFEIMERRSGCKSWRLNRPKIHLYLQTVPALVTNQVSAYTPILNCRARLRGVRPCGLVRAPSAGGKPASRSPTEVPDQARSNCTGQTRGLCIRIRLWGFQLICDWL